MRTTLGRIVAVLLAAVLGVLLARAVVGLPRYGESRGPDERRFAIQAVNARQATNLNAFVNFDYRGFDTLGEEFIFLVAVAAFSLLLAERRGEGETRLQPPSPGRGDDTNDPVLRVVTIAYAPIAVMYGIYMVMHGQLTPGGGFQGGVVVATGVLAMWFGIDSEQWDAVVPKDGSEGFETIGAIGYVGVGVAGLVAAGLFLRNVLPLGTTGALFSGGTIDLLNGLVGIAISGGFAVVTSEFVKETREPVDPA